MTPLRAPGDSARADHAVAVPVAVPATANVEPSSAMRGQLTEMLSTLNQQVMKIESQIEQLQESRATNRSESGPAPPPRLPTRAEAPPPPPPLAVQQPEHDAEAASAPRGASHKRKKPTAATRKRPAAARKRSPANARDENSEQRWPDKSTTTSSAAAAAAAIDAKLQSSSSRFERLWAPRSGKRQRKTPPRFN